MATYGLTQHTQDLMFGGAFTDAFDTIASVAASTVITSSLAILPLPYDCKVYRVTLSYTASASTATTLQIAYGTGTLGSVGSTDTNAVPGTVLFSTPVTVSNALAGQVQAWEPDNFDVIYQSSSPLATAVRSASSLAIVGNALTLRMTTNAGGAVTNLKVMIALKAYNQHAAATGLPSPEGNYTGFDGSMF